MVLGFTEEKQVVKINLFEEYVEDSVSVYHLRHVGVVTFFYLAMFLRSQCFFIA